MDLDAGELEAISLAQEIHADAILMDDQAGRNAAKKCRLTVVGTVGILEQAAARGLIILPEIMERLCNTNVRLDPKLIQAALERDKDRRQNK